jgi:hypothetical protein
MLDLKHGGHVPAEVAEGAHEAAETMAFRQAKKPRPKETPFEYLLPNLKDDPNSHIPGDPATVTAALKALGTAMIDNAPGIVPVPPGPKANSPIPAVYTYWGQFIDHDMTANTDRDGAVSDIRKSPIKPLPPKFVVDNLKNLRRPTFDLDSVYGNGPGLDDNDDRPDPGPADKGFYDGIRMRVGDNADVGGVRIPPDADLKRDLPRIGPLLDQHVITDDDIPDTLKNDVNKKTRAFIGDSRNDENLIVAQFHLAFLRFHNNVVDAIEKTPKDFGLNKNAKPERKFATARRLVRWQYQWLVVNDYLKTVTLPGVVDKVLVDGTKFYEPLKGGVLFAPLEYSVAAYRFGHSMVREVYDHNRRFGIPVPPQPPITDPTKIPFATFAQLFQFTGNGFVFDPNPKDTTLTKSKPNPMAGLPTLPSNWIIEWDRMTRKNDPNEAHFARKIDTHLAFPSLHNMVNEGNEDEFKNDEPLRKILRDLAQRNLLRGYLLSIPTGQAVAKAMGVPVLSEAELLQGNSQAVNDALAAGGFLKNTPLWYYILKEAEVRANGDSLGELGSRIVIETQIGLLENDARSYLNADDGWDPSKGVRLANGAPITTIRDFFEFADLAA